MKVDTPERKPWEEYPQIWKTESEFWTYVRGSLRRGLWEKSPIKLSFKNSECEPPPDDYTGRAKSGKECALSGEWTGKSKMEVDHVEGNVSMLSWGDLKDFVLHLIPPPGSLQLVSKEAHKIKSYAERMGYTYERAVAEKQAIAINKTAQKSRQWLMERGIVPLSDAKKRRKQIVEQLLGGN